MPSDTMRWMVCTASGDPCGQTFGTQEEADAAQTRYPVGCDYHVRPVEIVVRGQPPAPWCYRAALRPARDGEGRGEG